MQARSILSKRKPLFVFKSSMIHNPRLVDLYNESEESDGSYLNIKKTIHDLKLERIFEFDDESKTFSYLGPWEYIKFTYPLLFKFGKCFSAFTFYNIGRSDVMDYLSCYCPKEESCFSDDSQKLSILERNSRDFFASAHDLKDGGAVLDMDVFGSKNLCIGESHNQSYSRRFIIENMQTFARKGYKTLFLEHLFYDSVMQDALNLYMQEDCDLDNMPKDLEKYLISLGRSYCSSAEPYDERYNFFTLVKEAKRCGLRLVGIDTVESYKMGMSAFGSQGAERMLGMNYEARRIIEKEYRGEKFIALMGNAHISKHYGVLGVSQIIPNSVAVDIYADECEQSTCVIGSNTRKIGKYEINSEVRIACKRDSSLALERLFGPRQHPDTLSDNNAAIDAFLDNIKKIKDIFLLHRLFVIKNDSFLTIEQQEFQEWYQENKLDLGERTAIAPTVTAVSSEFFMILSSARNFDKYKNVLPGINLFLRLDDDSLIRSILNKHPDLIRTLNFAEQFEALYTKWQKYKLMKIDMVTQIYNNLISGQAYEGYELITTADYFLLQPPGEAEPIVFTKDAEDNAKNIKIEDLERIISTSLSTTQPPEDLRSPAQASIENQWPHQKEEAKPTTIYRPVFATGYWAQIGHRRNDFRAIDGLYETIDIAPLKRSLLKEAVTSDLESKEEKIKLTMISNVIRAAVDSNLVILNEDGGFDCNNIVMALLKAKTQGGIANKVITLEEIESNDQEKKFSQLVQKYNKESGIFSGRVENLKSGDAMQFGLRTTFLPHNVINFFEQKNREKSSVDRDALQCCIEYTTAELNPKLLALQGTPFCGRT